MRELPFRKSHPKGLYTLFATEMWERFSYYGMRALLTLYLTAELVNGGFGLDREAALEMYAIFTGLVYLTPILGGWISDKYLGQRKTVYIGGLVMAVGQFLLAASALLYQSAESASDSRQFLFNFGLGVLIIGNGFFKPNISTVVGEFYNDNDPMKDAAFNIFYLGINLGAILGTFIAGGLGESVEWGYGFLAAGVGMILGILWLKARENTLEYYGLPPNSPEGKQVLDGKDWSTIIIYVVGLILGTLLVIYIWGLLPDFITNIITIGGFTAIILALSYVIIKGIEGEDTWRKKFYILTAVVALFLIVKYAGIWDMIAGSIQNYILYALVGAILVGLVLLLRSKSNDWSRMGVIIVLAIFNIVFWAGFEQAGGTFSLFAKENTDRIMFGWEMPATWFQNVNSLAILIFASLFGLMWLWLDKKGWNPRTPVKFALGLFLGALAFFVMTQASNAATGGHLVSPWWLVSVYILLTLGELMLSPIGLSMITKLANPKLVSVVMGLWMASFAAGNYMAGMLESILHKYDFELYPFITMVMLGSGVALLLLSVLLNKAMKGIH
jgi:POT family proton-dependent oligopeptide transporter